MKRLLLYFPLFLHLTFPLRAREGAETIRWITAHPGLRLRKGSTTQSTKLAYFTGQETSNLRILHAEQLAPGLYRLALYEGEDSSRFHLARIRSLGGGLFLWTNTGNFDQKHKFATGSALERYPITQEEGCEH